MRRARKMLGIKIGLIRVLTLRDKKLLESHGKLIEQYFPSLSIITRCIQDQPRGIYDKESEEAAIPKIIDLGLKLRTEERAKVIIVSCAADLGVRALRERLEIPVIGAGNAVASLALAYGRKVGSLGISDRTPQPIKEILRDCLVAEAKPEGIKTTLDLMSKEAKYASLKAAKLLKQRGAEIIALACTGYSTLRIAEELENEVRIPVLDPVLATGLFAWYFIRNQLKNK